MSEDDSTGRTLGGGRSNEPWNRVTSSGPRIGRIGAWGSSSSSGVGSSGGRRIATLGDLSRGGGPAGGQGGGGHSHSHGGSDDEDEDDEDSGKDQGESWFAGGERSGLSIQNPDRRAQQPGGNLVRDLLQRAAEAGPPSGPSAPPRSTVFSGGGHTLGSDEVESAYVPDPNAIAEQEEEPAIRHLTFWRDGFSVEDGELMRYGDPVNEQILNEINSGRAPPSILNVEPGRPVELRVVKRLHDDYVPAPASKRQGGGVFSGEGHRLGSPVPAASGIGMPGSFPSGAAGPSGSTSPRAVPTEGLSTRFEVDQTLPTTSVQIRLADGTRMVCRMNHTHTVQDIRNFINASRPENLTRPYTIGTTFPNRTLDDNTQTIEVAGLKNSVIVQRWV